MVTENENSKEQFAEWKAPEVNPKETTNSPEQKRQLTLRSYLETANPEELQHRVLDSLAQIEDPIRLKLKLRELNVAENPTEAELQVAISQYIESYQERVKELQEFIPEHLKKVNEWLQQEGLTPKQNPEAIPVYINDYLLHSGVEKEFPAIFGEVFDGEQNTVSVTGKHGRNILAHEYFHGMSHDPNTKDTGFKRMTEGKLEGNLWLDEGATMIGEFATYPTKEAGKRDEIDEMYDEGYRWLTELYMQELGISQTELLKAYFGEEPYRSQLEEKTKQRFGCTITELNDIFFGYSDEAKEQTIKIIKGEPVILEAMEGSGLDEHYQRLQRIFPHIEVVVRPRPTFE